jgi:hypothetical protein
MVRFLLENGANPKIKDKTGRNALEIAQHFNVHSIVKILQEFDNKGQFLKPKLEFPSGIKNPDLDPNIWIQTKSPFKFVENNFSEESIQCLDGKVRVHPLVHSLCPALKKQHGTLNYNMVRPVSLSPRMLLKLFVISCTPMC